jgi:glycerol-3-phosphate dehydrogenase
MRNAEPVGFKHVIYSIPDIDTKGILITPQVNGDLLIGPNSIEVLDKNDYSISNNRLEFIKKQALKLSDRIPFNDSFINFAGVRAKSTHDDFYIKESLEYKGFYHLAGIDSPGLTAAPAIAEYFLTLISSSFKLTKKRL